MREAGGLAERCGSASAEVRHAVDRASGELPDHVVSMSAPEPLDARLAAGPGHLVIVDGNAPNLVPRFDPYSHLVYAARGDNVRATIVEGAVLYLDGEFRTLDAAATLAAARGQANRVREAVGLPTR